MNINIKLDKNFTTMFNRLSAEYGTEMSALNGFSDEQLSYTDFISNFIDKQTVADASIDGNANVGRKDIVSLENEMSKPHSKLLAFNKIYYEINKEYGFSTANKWIRGEWIGDFYLHDAVSSSFRPYCFAYDIDDLVNKGLYFIDGFNAQPPQHLITYTDFVIEYINWTCNRSSGAVGIPSFIVYAYYFWKNDCENDYYVKSPEYYRRQECQRICYKINQPYVRDGIQSAFTNFSMFDRPYLEALFGGKTFPDGSFMIDHIEEIIEYQKVFMEVVSDIRSVNMMTFPVLSFALLRKDGKFVDDEFARWACKHNMKWADSNFFVSDNVNSLSNCCRLKSDINSLGYFNSIGGTALEVGSVKVNTINLARISYEAKTQDAYIEILRERTELCCQALHAVRHIIQRNIEKGLLPNYSLDIMHLKSQYNTVGIIGIYESLQKFGYIKKDKLGYISYTDDGIIFAKRILETIHDVKSVFLSEKDYMINIEQIPGERAAYVLMQKDKCLFPKEKYELPLYGNQWIPLGVKTSIKNKVEISAILDKACSGGSICHVNCDSPFTSFDVAWDMLNYVADAGVDYFAFCTRISACSMNHGFYGTTCPTCGGPVETTYQRIVGFLVPEKTYSKERKAEFRLRDWFEINRMSEI